MKIKYSVIASTVLLICFVCTQFTRHTRTNAVPQAELTVIMYHSFLKDTSKSGKYVITPDEFENDIIYLKNNGCNFVSVTDIKNFKNDVKVLPSKSVLITIDDGNYNNYCYIFPILKKYQIPALISPIGYWVEHYSLTGEKNPSYSVLTSDCIYEMANSGLVEFGNHTYNLHSDKLRMGMQKLDGENSEKYKSMITEDLTKAHNIILNSSGKVPCALVFPYGIICDDALAVVEKMGYDILFSCTEGKNYISPTDKTYILKRFNRPSGINSHEFFSGIQR